MPLPRPLQHSHKTSLPRGCSASPSCRWQLWGQQRGTASGWEGGTGGDSSTGQDRSRRAEPHGRWKDCRRAASAASVQAEQGLGSAQATTGKPREQVKLRCAGRCAAASHSRLHSHLVHISPATKEGVCKLLPTAGEGVQNDSQGQRLGGFPAPWQVEAAASASVAAGRQGGEGACRRQWGGVGGLGGRGGRSRGGVRRRLVSAHRRQKAALRCEMQGC